jgi:2-methylcitrate dehydratase PrpD
MATASLSRRLAEYACRLSFSDLSSEHVKKMKLFFLDWLGSAYAGQKERPVTMMLQVVQEMGGNSESTIIPDGSKTSCLLAALINGASSHVVEMDDLHRGSILHPAAAIIPALLALAERERSAGADLILAVSVGYEVGIRIALAVGPSHYRFWHTTATCGTFGAAAGSAKILDLNKDQFVWALGSAGTQAAGLWEFLVEGAMSKQLHPGKAAMNGLLAALLAQKGFSGASGILEGQKGFFRATSKDFDEDKCLKGLGHVFLGEQNSLKFYASCGHTHSAIEAALQAVRHRPLMAETIEKVNVFVYQAALDLLGGVQPTSPYAAKFNLPFCVATALRYGHVNTGDFSSARLKDRDILQLVDRIHMVSDPALSGSYPEKWPARVEIFMRDGRRLDGAVDYPKGDPENPLVEQEVIEKFRGLTADLVPPSVADRLIERTLNLEQEDDVSGFWE